MLTLLLGFASTGAALLFGAALGLYFRIWIMIPATMVVILASVAMLAGSPLAVWMQVVCILGLIMALQLGYLLGSAFGPALMTQARRKNRDTRLIRSARTE